MKIDPNTVYVPLSDKEREDHRIQAKKISEEEFQSIFYKNEGIYKYLDGKSIIWERPDLKNPHYYTIKASSIAVYKKSGELKKNASDEYLLPHPVKGMRPLLNTDFHPFKKTDDHVDVWIFTDPTKPYIICIVNDIKEIEDDGFMTRKERKEKLLNDYAERKMKDEVARSKASEEFEKRARKTQIT